MKLDRSKVEMIRQGLLNSEWCGFSKRETVNDLCDLAILGLGAAPTEEAPTSVADWYSEHSDDELRRRHQIATDQDAPDHMRGETFEKWAEAEGYIPGKVLRSHMNGVSR